MVCMNVGLQDVAWTDYILWFVCGKMGEYYHKTFWMKVGL